MNHGVFFSGKRVEYFFQILLGHADPGILYPEAASHIPGAFRRFLLLQIGIDSTALRRKFQCVGQKVDENLIQPYAVTVYLFHAALADENIKMQVFRLDLRPDNIYDILHGIL